MSNTISFLLPSLPASMNDLYCIRRSSIYSPVPTLDIKDEHKLWRTSVAKSIPRFTVAPNSLVRVDRIYYYPWFYKNGSWRRFDSFNLDAMLFNLIKTRIDHDDMFFKEGLLQSRNSPDRRALVTLTEIPESEWRAWE